jgi:hypothetical protein
VLLVVADGRTASAKTTTPSATNVDHTMPFPATTVATRTTRDSEERHRIDRAFVARPHPGSVDITGTASIFRTYNSLVK